MIRLESIDIGVSYSSSLVVISFVIISTSECGFLTPSYIWPYLDVMGWKTRNTTSQTLCSYLQYIDLFLTWKYPTEWLVHPGVGLSLSVPGRVCTSHHYMIWIHANFLYRSLRSGRLILWDRAEAKVWETNLAAGIHRKCCYVNCYGNQVQNWGMCSDF